jgi:hypothetical protein
MKNIVRAGQIKCFEQGGQNGFLKTVGWAG